MQETVAVRTRIEPAVQNTTTLDVLRFLLDPTGLKDLSRQVVPVIHGHASV